MSFKFKKGSIVKVIDTNMLYLEYSKMALKLNATNWEKYRNIPDNKNKCYIVINFAENEYRNDTVYLIKDNVSSNEYLISEKGIISGSKYSIGDEVTIKTWETMSKEFRMFGDEDIDVNGILYLSEMKKYCGKTYTIKEFIGKSQYTLNDIDLCYTFTEAMFEKTTIRNKEDSYMFYYKVKDVRDAKAILGMAYGFGWLVGYALKPETIVKIKYIVFNSKTKIALPHEAMEHKGHKVLETFDDVILFLRKNDTCKTYKKEFIAALKQTAKEYINGTHIYDITKCHLCKTVAKIKGILYEDMYQSEDTCNICPWMVITGKVCHDTKYEESKRVAEIMEWIKKYEKMED